MKAKEHLQEVHKAQVLHIADVMRCLIADPLANEIDTDYVKDKLEEYLWELIDKEGNIAHGLIVALEHHLEK